MEVVLAISEAKDYTKRKLNTLRREKKKINGAFKKKLFLKKVTKRP